MSEYKFSCPHCDQHLSGTSDWVGRPLKCPTCQKDFNVPPTPGAPAAPAAPVTSAPPRPPGPPRATPSPTRAPMVPSPMPGRAAAAGASNSNGQALASLICGIAGFLGFGLLTGIPAVICGHLALARIKYGRAVKGRGMAITGLVMGYTAIVASLVLTLFLFVGMVKAVEMQASGMRPPSRSVPVMPDRGNPDRGNPDRGNPNRGTPNRSPGR